MPSTTPHGGAYHRWIAAQPRKVEIPYAARLAQLIPPVSNRLRRDFGAILTLISTHALLHQATRPVDDRSAVIATPADYAQIRELVGDLVSHAVGVSVKPSIRETVTTVTRMLNHYPDGVPQTALATTLGLDKGTTRRRVTDGIRAGYLRNLEERPGRAARLQPDEPLPDDRPILPEPGELQLQSHH